MKITIIILQLIILILLPIWVLKVVHYFIHPIPALFNSPSVIPTTETVTWQKIDFSQSIFNVALFGLFFVQHILMATIFFKSKMQQLIPKYPIYQRPIYNVVSSILIYFILQFQNPQNCIVFSIPSSLRWPFIIAGLYFMIDANRQMEGSLLFKYDFIKLLTQKQYLAQIKQQNYGQVFSSGISVKGAYGLIRHPMQSGFLLLMIFGSNIFTVQKLVASIFMFIAIYIGVKMEQMRLIKRYSQYKKYMDQIKWRFIPYIF